MGSGPGDRRETGKSDKKRDVETDIDTSLITNEDDHLPSITDPVSCKTPRPLRDVKNKSTTKVPVWGRSIR